MNPRWMPATRRLVVVAVSRLVVLLIFISAGEAFGYGCQTDRSQMVALEVLPLWVYGLIVVGCPLVVLARLVWGPSPWGIQQHKEEEQTQEQAEGDCSAATCSACLNWEPRQNSGMGDGYCPIFDKFTDPDHGKRCTAFLPNTPAQEGEKGEL